VRPLRHFVSEVQSRSEREFTRLEPHPFLIHSSSHGGPMKPLDTTGGFTIDRLVLESRGPGSGPVNLGETFHAAVVKTRRVMSDDGRITVGLSSTCDVVINDQSLSKLHAWFGVRGDTWRIWDNASVAGTQVNGVSVAAMGSTALETGDRIGLGYVEVVFLLPDAFYNLVKRLLC
jgi:pSer/pThr/pTyr-binding forkhead associated (FHA) protein